MAGLANTAVWEDEIYQIEQTDPVVGGPPDLPLGQGITNVPHQHLANRTAWLKAELAIVTQALANIDISEQISAAINDLIDGAPGALDTLRELAEAMGDNDDAMAALTTQIGQKLDANSDVYARSSNPQIDGSILVSGPQPMITFSDNDGGSQHVYQWTTNPLSDDGLTRLWGQFGLQRDNGDGTFTNLITFQSNGRATIWNGATSDEAIDGIDNTRMMTPFRTHEAVSAVLAADNSRSSAWVNFNGKGTVSIREAFNVASITDLGAGLYQVNFATPMANTNYAIWGQQANADTVGDERGDVYIHSKTTAYAQFYTVNVNGAAGDWDHVSILIMGGQ
jgi:hypothetical protein